MCATAQSSTSPPPSSAPEKTRRLFFTLTKYVLRLLLWLRYRVHTQGLENLCADKHDTRPLLILPSHSALVDPLIIYSLLADYRPRAMADARQVDRPLIRTLIRPLRPLIIPDMQLDGREAAQAVREALEQAAASLAAGEALLLYPTGRLTRDGRDTVGSNSGAFSLYSRVPHCRVVLVRIRGLWGSSFSYAPCNGRGGKAPEFFSALLGAVYKLCANVVLCMPRRPVKVVFAEKAMPAPAEGLLAFNQALEDFYHAEAQDPVAVPYFFWSSKANRACRPTTTPITTGHCAEKDERIQDIDPALRDTVLTILTQTSGITHFSLSSTLAGDLGIDSLSLVDVAVQLEETFGHPIPRLEQLHTVADCLLAATGHVPADDLPQPPPAWTAAAPAMAEPPSPVHLPAGTSIPELFFRQARQDPQRLFLADSSGVLSRKQVLLRALALASALRAHYPREHRLGIMLPASSAATVVWLAVVLAGKTPVMFNWTTGERNFRHCLALSGVAHVLTARKLMQRLEKQGFSAEILPTLQGADKSSGWVYLEDMAAGLDLRHKLCAALHSGLVLAGLPHLARALIKSKDKLPTGQGIAVILFTSGSESLPKAVPLSHANILANCSDVAAVLGLHSADSMLGMLPPFHSLGLTGNVVVPLVFGMPVIYHPNPTEAVQLNGICRLWQPSVTVSPPTFLEAMLHKAHRGDLASLRLVFVGAEKCPPAVYEAFTAHTGGGKLCEGYGVTECSPGVCVNPPADPRPGTIGKALPSVSLAVVVEAEGQPLRRAAPEEQGMLLIVGPNVFSGYLPDNATKPEASAAKEQPFVCFEGRSWFRSGDLVSADAKGHLTFRGRLKRFVKLGGGDAVLAPNGRNLAGSLCPPAQWPRRPTAGHGKL